MTPELLSQIGQLLYGQDWRTALARELGVNERTVRGWMNPDSAYASPPDRIIPVLIRLLECRMAAILSAQSALDALGRETVHNPPIKLS